MSLVRISLSTESKRQYINDVFQEGVEYFVCVKNALSAFFDLVYTYTDCGPLEHVYLAWLTFLALLYLKLIKLQSKRWSKLQEDEITSVLFKDPFVFTILLYTVTKVICTVLKILKYYNKSYPAYVCVVVLSVDVYVFWDDIVSLKEWVKGRFRKILNHSSKTKVKHPIEKENLTQNRAIQLWKAARHGFIDQVQMLLEKAQMTQFLHGYYGPKKWTVLEAAVASGNVKLMKLLLQHAQIKDYIDGSYWDILFVATECRHPNMIRYLVNTFPRLKNYLDNTSEKHNDLCVLDLAVTNGCLQCVKVLINLGAEFDLADESTGNTLLHITVLYEHYDIAQYLLENYSCVREMLDSVNDSNDDPLDLALAQQNWKMSELLIVHRARTKSGDHENILTTIYTHKELFHLDVVALNHGHSPNFNDLEHKQLVITTLLSCRVKVTNGRGNTVFLLHLHRKEHLQRMLDKLALLIQYGFDTSLMDIAYQADENHTFLTVILINAYYEFNSRDYIQYRNSYLGLLYESGYSFQHEMGTRSNKLADKDDQFVLVMKKLRCMPLTLRRLSGNVIRLALKPNASAVKKLQIPTLLEDIILMRGHPRHDYPIGCLH